MDLSAPPTPFDLVILDRAAANCFVNSSNRNTNGNPCHGSGNGKKNKPPKSSEVVVSYPGSSSSSSSYAEHGGFSSSSSVGSVVDGIIMSDMSLNSRPPIRNQCVNIQRRSLNHHENQSKLQKSASEMSVVKISSQNHQRMLRNSSCDSEFWLRVVPSCKVKPRECDEVPEEFKRAGIGLCFGGKNHEILTKLAQN